ncbi:MAG: OB-fold nucleic acid binding domain-containing protein [Candidatus Aenigmatarchaeota archaeon]
MLVLSRKKLILISSLASVLGLLLIYAASIFSQPKEISLEEISSELIGKTISTSGYIISKRVSPDGHIFLTISQNKAKIQVPLFANFLEKMREENRNTNFKVGQKIFVEGIVDEYKGQLQIIPRKVSDVRIIG